MSATSATVILQGEKSVMQNVLVVGDAADGVRASGGSAHIRDCTISGPGGAGISVDNTAEDTWITDNDIEDAATHGILIDVPATTATRRVHVTGNTIVNPSRAIAGTYDGVHVANPSVGTSLAHVITGNIVHSTTSSHRDGVRLAGANVTSCVVCSNVSIGHGGAEVTDSGTSTAICASGAHTHDGTTGGGSIDHDDLTNVTADQHHAEAHTVASHSDTTATGTELGTLTDGSNADALHVHAGAGHTVASHSDTTGTGAELETLTDGSNADALHVHAAAAHTIASHSDTTATGAELETLTDGSNADALHAHSGGASPLTTKGDLFGFDTGDARLPVGTNDHVLTADSTTGLGVAWKASTTGGLDLTTKGQIHTHSTVDAALTVGANDEILVADSAAATGLDWKTIAVALEALLTTKGDTVVNNGTTVVRVPVGTNDQVLTADSAQTEGLKWATPAAGSGSYAFCAQTVLGSDTASVSFTDTDWGSDAEDLVLVCVARTDRASNASDGFSLQVGTGGTVDSGANYMYNESERGTTDLDAGANAATAVNSQAGACFTGSTADSGAFGNLRMEFVGVPSTAMHTSMLWQSSKMSSDGERRHSTGGARWKNTAVMDILTITPLAGSNFVTGSRFTLYKRIAA